MAIAPCAAVGAGSLAVKGFRGNERANAMVFIPAKSLHGGGPPRSQGRNDGGPHAGTSTLGVIPANAGMQ